MASKKRCKQRGDFLFNYGIIGFMSQNTEGVSDLGNLQNFLNLCRKNTIFYLKIGLRHKTDNSVTLFFAILLVLFLM